MEETKYSEYWAEIGTSVLNEFAEDKFKPIIELGISIGYVESNESPERDGVPKLAECIVIKRDHQRQFNPHDYLIKVYTPNVQYMNDVQKRILMEHELMHINCYENKDADLKIGINNHDVNDFRDIIEKYGYDWAKDVHQQMTLDDIEYADDEEDAEEVPQIKGGGQLLPEDTAE